MSDLEDYTRSVAESLRGAGTGELNSGQYEGLVADGPARLVPRPGESEKHLSGYLLGHLLRWTHARGRGIDTSIVTATLYAAALAHEQSRRVLAKDDGVFRAHLYAALMAERKLQVALSDADERMCFGWLCEQAGVDVTAATVGRLERLRVKRLERIGLGQDTP